MSDSVGDSSSPARSLSMTRRRLLGTGAGIAAALGMGATQRAEAVGTNSIYEDAGVPDQQGGALFALDAGIDGSSNGSRVRLGTLGHHHKWIGSESQALSIDGTDSLDSDSRKLWQSDPDEISERPLNFGVTVVDGTVFFQKGRVFAVDAETGEKQWQFETGSSRRGSVPQVIDSTAYIGDDALYALDAETGDQRWRYKPPSQSEQSQITRVLKPTVTSGTVFTSYIEEPRRGGVLAVDAETGDKQWQFETGDAVESAPTIINDTVFFGSYDNHVYALDAETGDERWQFETGDSISSSPTVVDGTIFIGSNDNHIYALDTETGGEEWHFGTGGVVSSSPTVADGMIFIGSIDSHVYALDAKTGDEEWHFETGDWVKSSPTVADGTIFIGSSDSRIYALDTKTGDEEWHFETEAAVNSSPIVVNGVLFVGNNAPTSVEDTDAVHEDDYRTGDTDQDVPGFGIVSALTALGGLGYLLRRRLTDNEIKNQ